MAVLNVVVDRLPCGLRVQVLTLPHAHSVCQALLVKAGPRYESRRKNGISHLVEHLLFRGTVPHPDSLSFHVAVEALGGEINGLTQRDATNIHLTVPPRVAFEGLTLLGEICTEPILAGLSVERDVVLEEILDSVDASGADLDIDSLSRRALWRGHPMSMPVAGTIARVEALTEEDCRSHYDRTFVAENSILCVAGPVEPREVLEQASIAFARIPRGGLSAEPPPPVPARRAPIQVQPTDDSQVSVLVTYPAPHESHPDFSRLLLMKRILDDGFASRLRQDICERRGLAYSLAVSVDAYVDAGAIDVELSCAPRKLRAAVEQIFRTLDGLTARPVDDAELDRAKTRHRADLEFALDDPSEICGWYGTSELIGCPFGYEERLTEVLETSPDDIRRLAREMFDPDSALVTLVGPARSAEVRGLARMLGRPSSSVEWLAGEAEEESGDDPVLTA